MTSWSCHRLRAELVDFAEGKLGEPRRLHVERHLSSCPDCAEAVLELREVPGQLRRLASVDPPGEFWKRQRAAILDSIDNSPTVGRPGIPRTSERRAWKLPLALAASLAVTVAAAGWWTTHVSTPTGPPLPSQPIQVASVARPDETPSTSWEPTAESNDVLYVEDTSLLSLAEQLDEESGETINDGLI